jgi:glycosyltransferase involved in cell wall biosynthesis
MVNNILMMRKAKVTVLMPAYNAEKFIRNAIMSIQNQSFSDWQLLIINDGSTDGTPQICNELALLDKRITLMNQENLGITATLNKGLTLISTELVARHDADDFSHKDRLKKQVRFLDQNPNISLVGTCFREIFDDGTHLDAHLETTDYYIKKTLHFRNAFGHGSVCFRTKDFQSINGYSVDTKFNYIEDYEAWLKMASKYQVANLPDVLYTYRSHSENISTKKKPAQEKNAEYLLSLIKKGEYKLEPKQTPIASLGAEFIACVKKGNFGAFKRCLRLEINASQNPV